MKIFFSLVFLLFSAICIPAQTTQPTPTQTRPRIVSNSAAAPSYTPSPMPTPKTVIVTNNLPAPTRTPAPDPYWTMTPRPSPVTNPTPVNRPVNSASNAQLPANSKNLSLGQLRAKISEARRLMQSRPIPTAITDSFLVTDVVRLAFYDWKAKQIDFAVITKTIFLSRGSEIPATTTNGKYVRVRIIRANGVNTPVSVIDQNNELHVPLIVQYPIERGGAFAEMAYYTSTHPGVVTPEVVSAGKLYIRNTIDIAREKLRQKGIFISPQVADVAERLATVEHVDHERFWTEHHPNIYNEIFTLFALNEGNTYRYSVSRAGAGGMVQMIPATYYMVRSRYYSVGLIPDFVEGMRNHPNAAQAMLLYMQMTWNDLLASQTIADALVNGLATPAELLSAGYNSNPAKLAGYINRGGENWRTLIPSETKIYLQIYASLERAVPMVKRKK